MNIHYLYYAFITTILGFICVPITAAPSSSLATAGLYRAEQIEVNGFPVIEPEVFHIVLNQDGTAYLAQPVAEPFNNDSFDSFVFVGLWKITKKNKKFIYFDLNLEAYFDDPLATFVPPGNCIGLDVCNSNLYFKGIIDTKNDIGQINGNGMLLNINDSAIVSSPFYLPGENFFSLKLKLNKETLKGNEALYENFSIPLPDAPTPADLNN